MKIANQDKELFWIRVQDIVSKFREKVDEEIILAIAATVLAFVFKRFGTGILIMVAIRIILKLVEVQAKKQQYLVQSTL